MRLLSYNIHKGVGGRDRRYQLERVLDVIEAENPDLICLQEVVRDNARARLDNQPQLLADRFKPAGMLFQQNVQYRQGGYGNLLLSRWPLTAHHQISLRFSQRKPRGAQIAVVETPEGPLHVVNVHLGLSEKERHWQIGHLLAHRLFRQSTHLPTLLIGDYNDWRNTLCRGPLTQGVCGLNEVTHPRSRFRSFPAWLPVGSIDKCFCCEKIDVHTARVVRTPLAKVASDHLPLVVDFHLAVQEQNGEAKHQITSTK